MKALARSTSERDMADSSATSRHHAPDICMAASLEPKSATSSENHGLNSAAIARDLPDPCGASRIGSVSTLQPGRLILATAPMNRQRLTARA